MPLGAYESLWEWVLYIVWIINRVYKSPLRMAYRELDSLFLNTFCYLKILKKLVILRINEIMRVW